MAKKIRFVDFLRENKDKLYHVANFWLIPRKLRVILKVALDSLFMLIGEQQAYAGAGIPGEGEQTRLCDIFITLPE